MASRRRIRAGADMRLPARAAARAGFRIVPVRPGTRHPHLAGYADEATTDLDAVDEYWGRWPDASIGTVMGLDRVCLDVDNQRRFAELGREIPPTLTSRARRGPHYFYRVDGPTQSHHVPHIYDIIGDGGLVMLPPSPHHITGQSYRWVNDLPLAPAPDWLVEEATPKPRPAKAETHFEGLSYLPDQVVEILDEGREGYRSEVIASAYFTARNMGVSSDAIDVEFPRTPAGSKIVELGARWWEAEQARLASKYIPKDDFAAYRAAAVVAWALTQPVCDSDLRIVHAAAVLATAQGGPRFRAGQYLFALTAGINVRTFRKRQASLVDWGYLQSVHRPTPGLAGVWGLPNLTAPYREAHVDPQIAPSLMGDVAGALSSDAFRHKALGRAYRAFARSLVQERNGESRFGGELLLGGCEEVLVEHGLVDPRGRPVPEWRDLLPAIARRYGTDGSHERVERKLEKQRYWEQMDEVQPRLDAVAQSQARR